jgi:hypothetical protein
VLGLGSGAERKKGTPHSFSHQATLLVDPHVLLSKKAKRRGEEKVQMEGKKRRQKISQQNRMHTSLFDLLEIIEGQNPNSIY